VARHVRTCQAKGQPTANPTPQPTQALILLIQIEKQQAKEARWKKESQDPHRKSKRVDKI